MSENCTDCRDGILNRQKSKIGVPQCNDECPTETDCQGKQTYTDCVGLNASLDCVGTTTQNTLTEVLVAIDEKICEQSTNTCGVSVSDNDTCCGKLNAKIVVGTGLLKSIVANGRCEQLKISLACPTWNDVSYNPLSKWANNNSDFQPVQFSSVAGCKVTIRGVARVNSYNNLIDVFTYVFQLPVLHRPLIKRMFGGFIAQDGTNYRPYTIVIHEDGKVYVNITASGSYDLIPFEITFDTN